MALRRSKEERAEAAESRAMWARADVEADRRPEIAVLLRAVRAIDKVIAADEGSVVEPLGAAMSGARCACAEGLAKLGVPIP